MNRSLAKVPVKVLVKQDSIQNMLKQTLKGRATQFATSLVNVVHDNPALEDVDQMSVIQSAMVAATLNLPIDKNLGYMWLVPYKGQAQAQIGYKGYIQLAQRTGQYKAMNAVVVHEGELISWNALTEEVEYDPSKRESDEVIGYIGYFKLINGFEKTVYWTRDQIDQHRQRFSKMSGKEQPTGVWKSDFDAMALKTVIKGMLSKWGPLSIDMQKALISDENEPDEANFEETEAEDDQASETTESLLNDFKKSQKRKQVNADEHDSNEKQTATAAKQADKAEQGQLL